MPSFDGSSRPIFPQAHAFPAPVDRLASVQMLRGLAAMLVVTILFTALHAAELVHYPPGFVLIALLSMATLLLRAATGSLFPPVAAHFVYNVFAVLA